MGRLAFVLVLAMAGVAQAANVEPPRPLAHVEAPFPEEARRAGLTSGVVMLELDIDDQGRVTDARVVAPAGHGFDEAALAAARQIRFSPYRLDGKPLPARITFRYSFVLKIAPVREGVVLGGVVHEPVPPLQVRVRGTVHERGTRKPIEGAWVLAIDAANLTIGQTTTDEEGGFALRLPEGAIDCTVVVVATDHKTLRTHEHLGDKEQVTVRYVVARATYALYESTVRGAPPREEVARVSLDRDEILRIPGTRGDALAAVLNMPSVARSPFDLGQLVIRGSAPGESGAFLLGMQIPNAFHFSALTSTFNSYLLERIDLIPSNFSVRYGRYTGGIVDMMPREGRRDRYHGDAKIDIYDAHVIVEGPIGKGSFALSARRSFVDSVIGLFVDSFTVAPRYYDYEAQLDYPIAGGHFKLLFFGSDDDVSLVNKVAPDTDPTLAGTFSTRQWFHTLFASYRRNRGRWDWEATLAAGPQHYDGDVFAAARFNLDLVEIDARVEARYRVSKRFKLTMGADVQTDYFWVSVDAPQQTTEEVPLGPLGERPKLRLRDRGFEGSPAAYVQGDLWAIAERLLIVPGVRVEKLSAYDRVLAEPRLMMRMKLARAGDWWLKAGAGLFDQPQMAPTSDPVLGNPHLQPEQAWHFTLGFEARPIPQYRALWIDFNLFYKDIRHIATTSEAFTQRNGMIVPERYYDDGIGRVYGADLLIKHDNGKRVFGWLAYTLLKSERRDHPGSAWRPFEYDQTHILTLLGGYHFPFDIDAGVRFRYVTGNPTTLFQSGGIQDADQGVYIPIPKAPYSDRMPDFVQLDLRIDKRFTFKYWILAIYLDISNITNRGNVEGYAYSYDYTRKTAVTGQPIIPALGLRASF